MPGILHHVIIRGIERQDIFRDQADREDFVDRLSKLAPETRTSCYAWVLMTNHAHFLFRSGTCGLSELMRRLLTGYAVSFNRRHKRHGQLFQNRYKSIICQEDAYLKELVCYIHLNPLRAKMVEDFGALNRYAFRGHRLLAGKAECGWQDGGYVLGYFVESEAIASKRYLAYVEAGIALGRRPELVGGGLIRSPALAFALPAKYFASLGLPRLDINNSDIRWTGQGNAIRVGLLSIKGLAAKTQGRIVFHRRSGPYRSVRDFIDRIRPNDTEARALIHCGALDAFSVTGNRAALIWELVRRQTAGSNKPMPRKLFDVPSDAPSPIPPDSEHDRLRRELSVLGFLCDRHPMELFADTLNSRTVKAVHLADFIGKRIRMAAWLITGKVVYTKCGESMEFLTFEDETGIVETTFFPQVYRCFCHMIDRDRPYLLSGRVQQDGGAVTLTVEKVERITCGRQVMRG